MDKFFIRVRGVILFSFFLLNLSPATAQSTWSFIDNPHPTYNELSKQEKSLKDQFQKPIPLLGSCNTSIWLDYKIYQDRYPSFQKSGDYFSNFKYWKRHVVKNKSVFPYACIIGEPFEDLLSYHYYYLENEQADKAFYYCGVYSRPASNELEKYIALTLNQLIAYSKNKDMQPISKLLAINELQTVIKLNKDVEYFFIMLAKRNNEVDNRPRWKTEQIVKAINKKRLVFLDEAVRGNNLQSVLDTTNECKIR